jgi:hypothetical protein
MSDVLVPKRFLGISPGPDIEGLQLLATLSVELEDGSVLRVAFPAFSMRQHVMIEDHNATLDAQEAAAKKQTIVDA